MGKFSLSDSFEFAKPSYGLIGNNADCYTPSPLSWKRIGKMCRSVLSYTPWVKRLKVFAITSSYEVTTTQWHMRMSWNSWNSSTDTSCNVLTQFTNDRIINQRFQKPDESAEAFMRLLFEITQLCSFGDNKDEALRDSSIWARQTKQRLRSFHLRRIPHSRRSAGRESKWRHGWLLSLQPTCLTLSGKEPVRKNSKTHKKNPRTSSEDC